MYDYAKVGVDHLKSPATNLIDVERVDPEASSTDVLVAKESPTYSFELYLTLAILVRSREI